MRIGGPFPTSSKMAEMLTLTPAAAKRVATIAAKQAKPAILRLSVEGGGCSGFQYRFDLADAAEGDDAVSDLSVPQRHELHVDFLGVLAGDHVRVLANIIDPRNIVELDGAIIRPS